MTIRKTLMCTTLAVALGACQTPGGGFDSMNTAETIGTLGGGVAGALLGSQFGGGVGKVATIGVGSVLGALAGREAARYITGTDSRRAADAEERAMASNKPITWNNPESGNRGVIEPQRTFKNPTGQTCREYTHTIYVGGRPETAHGTACRQPDGTWKLVS